MAVPARVAADAAAADVQLAELALAAAQGNLPPSNEPPQPTNPPAPAPVPEPTPVPAPVPTAQPVDQTALLLQMQQSLRTVEGRLASETLERQRAQQRIEELQRQPPAPPAPTAAPVTDVERTEFGPETVDFITKIAQHFATQAVSQIGNRIALIEGRLNSTVQQVQQVAQVEQRSVADRYLTALTSAVPDWEAVNVDDNFLLWLQNRDKASNKAYMDLLQAAHEEGNAGSVIHIFNLYKQAHGLLVAENPPTNPPPTPPPSGRIDPTSLAAPSTTAPAPFPTGQPVQGKIWTMAEVDAMYKAYERKEMTKQVFEQKEQEYMQALREGRVQV